MAVTGKQFQRWVKAEYPRIEVLSAKLGVSNTTLYAWMKRPELDTTTVLALAQIGFPVAVEAARHITRPAVGQG